MFKKYSYIFILTYILSAVVFTGTAIASPQQKREDLEISATKRSKNKIDFLKNLKIGAKINEWTVSEIKQSDKENPEFSVTFKGILKTKAKYYNYFDVPWSYGMEFGNQLLLYLDDNAKNELPFKDVINFSYIADKKFPKLVKGSYGIMNVEINEITLTHCECDFNSHDNIAISKVINLKEVGRANFGEVENFKIYEEQNKIIEDFLGDSLVIK